MVNDAGMNPLTPPYLDTAAPPLSPASAGSVTASTDTGGTGDLAYQASSAARAGLAHNLSRPKPERSPLVVPFNPRRGWSEADLPRRVFAAAIFPYTAALVAVTVITGDANMILLMLLLGPPVYYSAARVLRPHGPSVERYARHWLASTAMVISIPVQVTMISMRLNQNLLGDYGTDTTAFIYIGFGLLAGFLGLLTAGWGLGAVAVRAIAQRS